MRYKVIYFYLPMNYAMVGSRIQHFSFSDEPSIISEYPGSDYEDDSRNYFRLGNTDVYRAYSTDYPSSFFVKIIEESDPLFNIDYAWWAGTDEDICKHIGADIYNPLIVPMIVDDEILNMQR